MLREPEGPAGKGPRLCLSWCRPFWRGKNSAMSNLVKKHHPRQKKYTPMIFFPKEKQNVGTVWHCHQCQHLALVRLGCRNSLTRRLNHHSHGGSNGQQTGKVSVAAAPTSLRLLRTGGWLCGAALCEVSSFGERGLCSQEQSKGEPKTSQTLSLFPGDGAAKDGSGHLWRDACSP